MRNKRGQLEANIGKLVGGVIGLVFLVVVGFVSVGLLMDSNLLTDGSAMDNSSDALVGNLTAGVDVISGKIVTIFTIAAAVLILGLIVYLAIRARQIQDTQGQSL